MLLTRMPRSPAPHNYPPGTKVSTHVVAGPYTAGYQQAAQELLPHPAPRPAPQYGYAQPQYGEVVQAQGAVTHIYKRKRRRGPSSPLMGEQRRRLPLVHFSAQPEHCFSWKSPCQRNPQTVLSLSRKVGECRPCGTVPRCLCTPRRRRRRRRSGTRRRRLRRFRTGTRTRSSSTRSRDWRSIRTGTRCRRARRSTRTGTRCRRRRRDPLRLPPRPPRRPPLGGAPPPPRRRFTQINKGLLS